MPKMTNKLLLEDALHHPTLTLQEMSCIKIMTTLCNSNRVLINLILKCKFCSSYPDIKLELRREEEWKGVEALANELVSQICKPALLKKRILDYLWPVSYRIILWKSIYASSIRNSFLQQFHWTSRGRIDNTRTIRCLIRNKNICVRKRFVLACSVCLDNEIIEIWGEMSSIDTAHLYAALGYDMYYLYRFWLHILEGSYYDREPHLDNALRQASYTGLLEAVKYLYSIAPENQKIPLQHLCIWELMSKIRWGELLEEDENDILCFVFVEMTDEMREHYFNSITKTSLSLLLHFSKYKLCLNLMEERLDSASACTVARALKMIFYTYHLEISKDEDCRLLFMDFLRKIPTRIRKTRKLKEASVEFLAVLIWDNFLFLLEKDAFQKVAKLPSLDFTFMDSEKQIDDSFHDGKWNLLHFIIKESITIPSMKIWRKALVDFLVTGGSDKAVVNRVLRFVRKVQSKNPN